MKERWSVGQLGGWLCFYLEQRLWVQLLRSSYFRTHWNLKGDSTSGNNKPQANWVYAEMQMLPETQEGVWHFPWIACVCAFLVMYLPGLVRSCRPVCSAAWFFPSSAVADIVNDSCLGTSGMWCSDLGVAAAATCYWHILCLADQMLNLLRFSLATNPITVQSSHIHLSDKF